MRQYLTIFFILFTTNVLHAQYKITYLGIFGGLNTPFSIDNGLYQDPRFQQQMTLKWNPVGINIGYDGEVFGVGFMPLLTQIGQNYKITNFDKGDMGSLKIKQMYLSLPVHVRVHSDLANPTRFNYQLGIQYNLLLSANEHIRYSADFMDIPPGVIIPEGSIDNFGYYFVPAENRSLNEINYRKSNVAVYFGVGMDFDITDNWSISASGTIAYSLLDPRTGVTGTPPYIFKRRNDLVLAGQLGINRIITTNRYNRERSAEKNPRLNNKKRKPKRAPFLRFTQH